MERGQRMQVGIVAGCLVVGACIVGGIWATRTPSGEGRRIVVDATAGKAPALLPATTRAVTTRPTQKLFFASLYKWNHETAIRMLIDDPDLALVEVPADGYATALHYAAVHGDIQMASMLLSFGAKLDAVETNHDGTPLEWASYGGQLKMVEYLLQNGAKVDAVTVKVAKDGELGLLRTPVKAAVYAEVSRMLSTPPTKRIITVRVRPVTTREATTMGATTGVRLFWPTTAGDVR